MRSELIKFNKQRLNNFSQSKIFDDERKSESVGFNESILFMFNELKEILMFFPKTLNTFKIN